MPSPTEALLRYRPWTGSVRGPLFGVAAIARTSLVLLARRKLFWALYALAGLIFFFFFYGQYLVVWIRLQTEGQSVGLLGVRVPVTSFLSFLDRLNLNGSGHTFGNFIWFQGYIAMIVLALAGSVLVGNDFQYRSLPFYLSKPIGRRHYVLGKVAGAGVFVNLLTTLPALVLFVQAGLLYDWQTYYTSHLRQLIGILGYGAILTVTMGLLLVATAVAVRRTVPLVMVWAGVFVLARMLANFLVDGQRFSPLWRLVDLWNNMYLLGLECLGVSSLATTGPQPNSVSALMVCAAVCVGSATYLAARVRGVEVIA